VIGVSAEEINPPNSRNTLVRNILIAVVIAGIAVGVVFLIVGAFSVYPTVPTQSG